MQRYVSYHVSEDIFQDCVLKLLEKELPKDNPERYISTCFKNSAIDYSRLKKRTNIEPGVFLESGDNADYRICAEDIVYRYNNLLNMMDNTLPKISKEAMLYVYVEDLSYKEAANKLKCSEANLKSYIFRAKNTLKNNIKNYYNGKIISKVSTITK